MLLGAFALVTAACGGTSEVVDTQPKPRTPITTTVIPTPQPPATTAAPTLPPSTTSGDVGGVVLGAPSPQLQLVRSAIDKVEAEPPSRIDGLIEVAGVDAEIGAIEISIPFSSSFDPVTGDGHMLLDFGSMMEALGGEDVPTELQGAFDRFEVRQIGDTTYMSFGLLTAMFGIETEWLSMPVEEGQGFTQDFSTGVNPYDATGMLNSLRNAGGEVTVVGTEDLRGIETTHYRARFDLETLANLDPDAFAELQDAAPMGDAELPMDLWIDDQGRVHRFLFEVEDADIGELLPGEEISSMRVQFDFSDYGGRVTVEAPPAGDVTDISELEDMFASMFEDFDV